MYIEANLNKVVDILLAKIMKLEKDNAYLLAANMELEKGVDKKDDNAKSAQQ